MPRFKATVAVTLLGACLAIIPVSTASATSPVVISQFRANGPGGDFVELANVSAAPVTLMPGGAWRLTDLLPSGNSACQLGASATAITLAPGQHLLLAEPSYSGSGDAARDLTLVGSQCSVPPYNDYIWNSGGILGLTVDAAGDSVAYGTLDPSNTPPDGPPLTPVPTNGDSFRRLNNGTKDTDNNQADFAAGAAIPRGLVATAPVPTGTTDNADNVTSAGARLKATVNPSGGLVSDCHFDYGTTTGYGQTAPCATMPTGTAATAVSATITGLSATTTYHFRVSVTTNAGPLTGLDKSFTTTEAAAPPSGTTNAATEVGSRSVMLNASINPQGETVTNCHYDYGTTVIYTASVPCETTPSGINPVSVPTFLDGLAASTGYHFRVVATTANGTLTGLDQGFTTTALGSPDDDQLVISQFRSRGPGGDFVELRNVSNANVVLAAGSWGVTSLRDDANLACPIVAPDTSPAVTIGPGQHYLLANATYAGTGDAAKDRAFVISGPPCTDPLFDAAGSITLSGGGDDAAAYGVLDPVFNPTPPEGKPIHAVPNDGRAMKRHQSGTQDTHANVDDFIAVVADPKNLGASAAAPTGSTGAASAIAETAARLNATVNPNGGTVSDCHFDYGTTTGYGQSVPCESNPAGTSATPVAANVTGLTASTTYHFRVVVITGGGTLTGLDAQFTTTVAGAPPTGSTGTATGIGSNTATMNASVNPQGSSVSDCHFDYGTSASYGQTIACATTPTGNDPVAVSAFLSGLSPATTYHFRIVTTTGNGALTGLDQTFSTSALVPGRRQGRDQPVPHPGSRRRLRRVDERVGGRRHHGGRLDPVQRLRHRQQRVQRRHTSLTPEVTLGPGQRYLITQTGWTGSGVAASDLPSSCRLPRSARRGRHADPGATGSADSVAYGTLTGATVSEPPEIRSVPSNGDAMRRRQSGTQDTGHNADDFEAVTADPRNQGATKPAPLGATIAPSDVTPTSATLKGTVNPFGESVSDCHFDWGTSDSYGQTVACDTTPSGSTSVAVSAPIAGLGALTDYHFRLVVTSPNGTLTTLDRTFKTAGPPSGTTDPATGVGATTATLKGTVNPNGAAVSDCHFEYGTTVAFGQTIGCASTPAGSAPVGVSAALTGLTPATGYHYRLVVTTSAPPTLEASAQTFTTGPAPSAATADATDVGATTATFNGSVDAEGESVSRAASTTGRRPPTGPAFRARRRCPGAHRCRSRPPRRA